MHNLQMESRYQSPGFHISLQSQKQSLTMVEAGDKIRSYLHLEDEMIVNHLELIGYDHHGNLVEYTESYSRPDKLEVRFVSNNTK